MHDTLIQKAKIAMATWRKSEEVCGSLVGYDVYRAFIELEAAIEAIQRAMETSTVEAP